MNIVLIVLWVIGVGVSLLATYTSFGWTMMTNFFPEGKRWWMPFVKFASIASYTALIVFRPF